MSKTALLQLEKDTQLKAARDLAAAVEAQNRDFTPEERTNVKSYLDAAKKAHQQLVEASGDAGMLDEISVLSQPLGDGKAAGLALPGAGKGKTLGERFTQAPEWENWLKTIAPGGTIPESYKNINSPAFSFAGFKDLVTGLADTSAGALVENDFRGLVVPFIGRPLTLRDIVTQGTTGSDTVEYVRVNTTTNAAAPVPEALTAAAIGAVVGGAIGTVDAVEAGQKPESAMTLEKVTATVKTIAHWIPATKRALSDAAQVRTLIDSFLRYGLEEELEDQMISGNGVGENFTGLLNVTGTQAQAWDTNILTTTRKARTKVRTPGRAVPTAYVLNPTDWETIDLLQDNEGRYHFGGPRQIGTPTLWGLPVVETEAIPAGTGLVGDFRTAVLWDREQANITASDSHADFFIRNLVAILAEMRAAFGVLRPAALVEIDLTA